MKSQGRRLVSLLWVLGVACSPSEDAPGDPYTEVGPPAEAAPVVDSVFPMEVMLARFRDGIPEVHALGGGRPSREDLVREVVRRMAAADTLAFEGLTLDLSGFAWLYFPTTVTARPPYELPPGMAWLRLQEGNRTGVMRALRELGGRTLEYQGHDCEATPTVEDRSRIWIGCRVDLSVDGEARSLRLFSSILERDGRFVVLSWENDF